MNSQDIWQIQVNERVYDANFEEVVEWINEGAILPEDKIRRGNLRWIKANKVPELYEYFHAETLGAEFPNAVFNEESESAEIYTNFQVEDFEKSTKQNIVSAQVSGSDNLLRFGSRALSVKEISTVENISTDLIACSVHPELEPAFICEICNVLYCKTCPHSFGSSVKLCLDCGGLCVPYTGQVGSEDKMHGSVNKPYRRTEKTEQQSGAFDEAQLKKEDLINALKYPLNFFTSFLIGAGLLVLLMFGVGLAIFGGKVFAAAASIFGLSAITLTFCVLAKIVENFSQKKFTQNFLPKVNRYNIWEDIIHPGFLSFAVYFVSFGLFAAITIGAGFYAQHKFMSELENVEAGMRQTDSRLNAVKNKMQSGTDIPDAPQNARFSADTNLQAAKTPDLEKMIETNKEKSFQEIFGANYLGDNEDLKKSVQSFMRISVPFHLPMLFAFIFGIVYFPAASSIAGSTRSFRKTVSPLSAVRTIKKFGLDYLKILILSMIFMVISVIVIFGCYSLLLNYNFKLAGIILAITLGSVTAFYFWIVFSYFLGMAVFNKSKNAAFHLTAV